MADDTPPPDETAPAAPAAAPAVQAPSDRAAALRAAIDAAAQAWVADRIYGSPVSQSTAAFNHLTGSLGALAERITAAVLAIE